MSGNAHQNSPELKLSACFVWPSNHSNQKIEHFLSKRTKKNRYCTFRGWNSLSSWLFCSNECWKWLSKPWLCCATFYVSVFLFSFLFPVTALPRVPHLFFWCQALVSPSATCKRTEAACCTSNATVRLVAPLAWQQRRQDTGSYLPMASCVCLCVWQRLRSLHSSRLCWQGKRQQEDAFILCSVKESMTLYF